MSEVQVETTAVPEKTQEQQFNELAAVAKMRAKMLSQLVRAHAADYLNTLAFAPRLGGNERADLIVKFLDMLEGVLDLGLDITGVQIPEKGPVGKRVVNIAGVLAQALDNRMLLLAQQMQDAEATNSEAIVTAEASLGENVTSGFAKTEESTNNEGVQ